MIGHALVAAAAADVGAVRTVRNVAARCTHTAAAGPRLGCGRGCCGRNRARSRCCSRSLMVIAGVVLVVVAMVVAVACCCRWS